MIKGKPPRLGLIYIHQPLYFVTFCALYRRPVLANERIHDVFRTYCVRGIDHGVGVGRYVIMPDHVHMFLRGDTGFDLGIWIRGLKRALCPERDFWQPGFFDHILRSNENYWQKWQYVRDNPIRANLVVRHDDWPFQGEIVDIDRA